MKVCYFIFSLLLLVACNPEEPAIPDHDILATDFKIFPQELPSNKWQGEPQLVLNLQTSEQYPCYNFSIGFAHSFEDGKLSIVLQEIYKPELCLTAFGPAIGVLELPESTRDLILIRGEQSDRYEVHITEEQVELVPQTPAFSEVVIPKTFRFPEHSFAIVCGTNLEQTELCGEFSKELQQIPGVTSFSFPEEGRIPFPDSSSGNWNNTPSRYYLYADESTLEVAIDHFKSFTRDKLVKNDGNTLMLLTWDNRSFYSFQYQD